MLRRGCRAQMQQLQQARSVPPAVGAGTRRRWSTAWCACARARDQRPVPRATCLRTHVPCMWVYDRSPAPGVMCRAVLCRAASHAHRMSAHPTALPLCQAPQGHTLRALKVADAFACSHSIQKRRYVQPLRVPIGCGSACRVFGLASPPTSPDGNDSACG